MKFKKTNIHLIATVGLAVIVAVLAAHAYTLSKELEVSKANSNRYKNFAVWLMVHNENEAFKRVDAELDARDKLREYMTPEGLAKFEAVIVPPLPPTARPLRPEKPVDDATLREIVAIRFASGN